MSDVKELEGCTIVGVWPGEEIEEHHVLAVEFEGTAQLVGLCGTELGMWLEWKKGDEQ